MKVCSKALPGSRVDLVLIAPIQDQSEYFVPLQFGDNLVQDPSNNNDQHRHKREAYDPYEAYYFYPKSLNQRQPARGYDGPYEEEEDESLINRRDAQQSNRVEGPNGQKYKYTPLFQYKATSQKRRKLFVPNLFG